MLEMELMHMNTSLIPKQHMSETCLELVGLMDFQDGISSELMKRSFLVFALGI